MIITCALPYVYAISSTITEPGVASTVKCLLATDTGNDNSGITYTVTCSTGASVTKTVNGNIMTLSFTAPAVGTVARSSTYTITVVASYSGQSRTSTITLTQNDVLKTSKPKIAITPSYINEVFDYTNTAAGTADKVLTINSPRFTLVPGVKVGLKFNIKNSAANPTLNVNNTGAYPIRINGAAVTNTFLQVYTVYILVFDGFAWNIVDFYYDRPYVVTEPIRICDTAEDTAAKTISITDYELATNDIIFVQFTNGSNINNPTLDIESTGAHAIKLNNIAVTPSNFTIDSEHIYRLTYDGSDWEIIGKYSTVMIDNEPVEMYDSYINTADGHQINSVNLEKITMTFSQFDTFYWYEALGTYPPSEW